MGPASRARTSSAPHQVLATTLKESKQSAVRQLCCVCLLYALQYWPLEGIARQGPLLEGVLTAATTDSAVETPGRRSFIC